MKSKHASNHMLSSSSRIFWFKKRWLIWLTFTMHFQTFICMFDKCGFMGDSMFTLDWVFSLSFLFLYFLSHIAPKNLMFVTSGWVAETHWIRGVSTEPIYSHLERSDVDFHFFSRLQTPFERDFQTPAFGVYFRFFEKKKTFFTKRQTPNAVFFERARFWRVVCSLAYFPL